MMYWVDKFLCKFQLFSLIYLLTIVTRVYRRPPRYGIELSDISRTVLMYAIIVHLCFGFYMYSNSAIFTFEGDFEYLSFIKDQIDDSLEDAI